MKTFVLLVIGSAFVVLLAVGAYFLYYGIGQRCRVLKTGGLSDRCVL